jgi:hypothetical protein
MSIENMARAPFAFSVACFLLMVAVGIQPAQANEKNCADQISERQQAEESRIDQQKALSLARTAKDFESKTKGTRPTSTPSISSTFSIRNAAPIRASTASMWFMRYRTKASM